MSNDRRPVVSGLGRIPVTRDLDNALLDTYRNVAFDAVTDAGLSMDDIDGLFVTPAALSAQPWMMFAANLAAYLGVTTSRLGMYENGGCSSFVALRAAMDAVSAGSCQAALVVAADTRPEYALDNMEYFIRNATNKQTGLHGAVNGLYGVGAPVPYYAMGHQRYMHQYDVSPEDVASAAVCLRDHATRCSFAQFREPVTVEDVLNSKVLSPPLHLLEASSVSSGACALLITPAVRKINPSRSVGFLGIGEHHCPAHFVPVDDDITRSKAVETAAVEAFANAGVKQNDIDVAEVYGVFAATELMLYEDLGYFERGHAAKAVKEGKTTFGAETVFNPSGGRLSLGHPAGATPLYEVAEVVAQIRGEAGANQVEGASIGLTHAEHGMMNGASIMILGEV